MSEPHRHARGVVFTLRIALLIAFAALCSAEFIGRMPMPPMKSPSASQLPLDPDCVDKYQLALVLPPLMPTSKRADNYQISVKKINQPLVLPPTTSNGACSYPTNANTAVFAYGAKNPDGTTTHNWPGFTIEARTNRPVKVKWVNELYEGGKGGQYVKHLFADVIDQTLHWANPQGLGANNMTCPKPLLPLARCTDFSPCMTSNSPSCSTAATSPSYQGPVPIVTHVHGQEQAFDFADGYAEAWYMPKYPLILTGPDGTYFPYGTWYNTFKLTSQSPRNFPLDIWTRGNAIFNYPNKQRATQLWYHDHVLGITRLNVYAGLAGLYQLRDGDVFKGPEFPGLPWPPPGIPKDPADVREIPIVVQDRMFDTAGQLMYPLNNLPPNIVLPNGEVPPKWIPEFFPVIDGKSYATMIVNGRTYPFQDVADEPYRLRLLNGCNARTLILYFSKSLPQGSDVVIPEGSQDRVKFQVIGNEAGFFPQAIEKEQLLLGPAERYDIVIDFKGLLNQTLYLLNSGPNVPYNGFNDYTDGQLTLNQAQIMKFAVKRPGNGTLDLNAINRGLQRGPANLNINRPADNRRQLTLVERNDGVLSGGPNVIALFLGRTTPGSTTTSGTAAPEKWEDQVTTNPRTNTVEEWDIINLTADAHPIHVHEVFFQVVKRTQITVDNAVYPPTWRIDANTPSFNDTTAKDSILQVPGNCPGGTCFVQKDTVMVPTQSIYTFRVTMPNRPGLFQWHCHLLEHEDNEMMRPWCVGQPGYKDPKNKTKLQCPGPGRRICGFPLAAGGIDPSCFNA